MPIQHNLTNMSTRYAVYKPLNKADYLAPGGIMNNVKVLLGSRIKELRLNRGLNQAELAEIISVDAKHISRIETGQTFPYPETLEAIAKALEVQIKELFEFEHIAERPVNVQCIEDMLKGAGDEKLRLIYKVVKAILR